MNYIVIFLKVLIISCCMIFVNTNNICWNTKLVTKQIQESYKVTFWKPVERNCGFLWLFTCTDRRKFYVTRYKDVPYNITQSYKECCPGYEWIDDKNEQCKPKCTKHCVHGQCTETGTCICDLGYVSHNDSVCIPTCIACCTGGICTDLNACQCNSTSTQPFNTTNSLSVCNDGSKMNSSGICEPISIPACDNLECTVPDNCTCLAGNQTTETSNTSSTICLDDCIHEQNMTQICENGDDCNSMQNFTNFWIGISIVLILSILILISGIYVCNKKGICKICKHERPMPNIKVSDEYIVTNSIYGWHS